MSQAKAGKVHILSADPPPDALIHIARYGGKFKPSTDNARKYSESIKELLDDVKYKHRNLAKRLRCLTKHKKQINAFDKAIDNIHKQHYSAKNVKAKRKPNISKSDWKQLRDAKKHFPNHVLRMADKNIGTSVIERDKWDASVIKSIDEAKYFKTTHIDKDKFEDYIQTATDEACKDFDTLTRGMEAMIRDLHRARDDQHSTKKNKRPGSIYGMPKLHKKQRDDGSYKIRIVVNHAASVITLISRANAQLWRHLRYKLEVQQEEEFGQADHPDRRHRPRRGDQRAQRLTRRATEARLRPRPETHGFGRFGYVRNVPEHHNLGH